MTYALIYDDVIVSLDLVIHDCDLPICIMMSTALVFLLEQSPVATEEATSLADRQFWWREDKVELRRRSMFPAADQSRKP